MCSTLTRPGWIRREEAHKGAASANLGGGAATIDSLFRLGGEKRDDLNGQGPPVCVPAGLQWVGAPAGMDEFYARVGRSWTGWARTAPPWKSTTPTAAAWTGSARRAAARRRCRAQAHLAEFYAHVGLDGCREKSFCTASLSTLGFPCGFGPRSLFSEVSFASPLWVGKGRPESCLRDAGVAGGSPMQPLWGELCPKISSFGPGATRQKQRRVGSRGGAKSCVECSSDGPDAGVA